MDKSLQAQQDTIRLPLYTEEGFRSDWAVFDQTLINCFAEYARDSSTGEGYTVVTKRPGFQTTGFEFTDFSIDDKNAKPLANMTMTSLYDSCIAAYYYATDNSIYIIEYKPIAQTSTIVGTIAGRNANDRVFLEECQLGSAIAQNPSFTVSLQNANLSSSAGYYAQSSGGVFIGGTLQTITAANFPVTLGKVITGPILQMNGLFYVATVDGLIYQTFTNFPYDLTATAWNSSLNYFACARYPDQLQGVFRYKHHLIAIGKDSIEFLNDDVDLTGKTTGTSISSTSQAFIKFGAISPKLVINVDDVLYWVSYGTTNTLGIWKLDGYTPVKISTKRQDLALLRDLPGQLTDPLTCLFAIVIGNKKHLGINNIVMYTMHYVGSTVDDLETYNFSANTASSNIMLYNIEDKTWWGIQIDDGRIAKLLPTSSFGNTVTINPYKQYVLIYFGPTTNDVGNNKLFYVKEAVSPGSYYDDVPCVTTNGGIFSQSPIKVCIQPNSYWFNNEKRKRISRLSLIFANSLTKDSGDSASYKIYVIYNKDNVVPNTGTANNFVRFIDIPNTFYRYYVNNLGMVRILALCIICRSKDSFTLKNIELNLAQGTN